MHVRHVYQVHLRLLNKLPQESCTPSGCLESASESYHREGQKKEYTCISRTSTDILVKKPPAPKKLIEENAICHTREGRSTRNKPNAGKSDAPGPQRTHTRQQSKGTPEPQCARIITPHRGAQVITPHRGRWVGVLRNTDHVVFEQPLPTLFARRLWSCSSVKSLKSKILITEANPGHSNQDVAAATTRWRAHALARPTLLIIVNYFVFNLN